MSEFKRLAQGILVAGQIAPGDIAAAKAAGVGAIVNNRPDGEVPDQPMGQEIEDAARQAGIAYHAIPVSSAGFSLPQVDAMIDAIDSAGGEVLAFCRTGTRSTLLWALAEAKRGRDPEAITRDAAQAGYDTTPVRPMLDMLAGKSGN